MCLFVCQSVYLFLNVYSSDYQSSMISKNNYQLSSPVLYHLLQSHGCLALQIRLIVPSRSQTLLTGRSVSVSMLLYMTHKYDLDEVFLIFTYTKLFSKPHYASKIQVDLTCLTPSKSHKRVRTTHQQRSYSNIGYSIGMKYTLRTFTQLFLKQSNLHQFIGSYSMIRLYIKAGIRLNQLCTFVYGTIYIK